MINIFFRKFITLTLLAYVLLNSLSASALNRLTYINKLQKLTDTQLKKYGLKEHITAITLSISTPNLDQPLSVYSGYTDFSGKNPNNSSKLFQIGSITKSFIAACLLQLENEPQLHFNINDRLDKYLPQYPSWADITIKQLLNMTSGIPDYLADDDYRYKLAAYPSYHWQPEEQIAYVANKPLQFTPGEKWHYSNTNYILAGMVISKLTGHTVEDELYKRFFHLNKQSQIKLSETYYISHRYPPTLEGRMIHGYHNGGTIGKFFQQNADVTFVSLSYAGAAGAIVSNTTNIIHWVRELFTTNHILPRQQLNELTSFISTKTGKPITNFTANDPDGFGLGVGASYVPGIGVVYNFAGMTLGYRAKYCYFLQTNIVISAASNSSVDDENDHLLELIMDAYFAINS